MQDHIKLFGSDRIAPLVTNVEMVVYLDFESTKNGYETLDYLIKKIKRLDSMGYSKVQIFNIITEGDNLQKCILNKSHYSLLVNFINDNIDAICSNIEDSI